MYLLASDFDNTLYINNNDFKNNILKIKEFINDNVFVIATGRSYEDFDNLTKGSVLFNYLIINHGATILKDDEIIFNQYIENNLLEQLKKDFDFDNLRYFACKEKIKVSIDDTEITKINICFPDNLIAKRATKYINDKYNGELKAYSLFHKNQIEIVSAKVDKANAIEYIRKLENLDKLDIYTVGDGYTDLLMIEEYNGYAMENSIDELKEIALKKVKSVSEIIDYLNVKIEYMNNHQVTNFINECFNYQGYFEKYMAKVYGDNVDDKKNHLTIKKGEEIVATALLVPNQIKMGEYIFCTLNVGSVCVDKKYRKQGYFRLLMNEIEKISREFDISILTGKKERYQKYGYYPNLLNLYQVSSENKGFSFEIMDGSLNSECLNLYENNSIHSLREEILFKKTAVQWKYEAYYIYKDKQFCGYLIYNTKLDYIDEIMTDQEIDVIKSFAHFKNVQYVSVRCLNNDYQFMKKISSYPNSRMYNRQLFKLNNIKKVLQSCLEYKLKNQTLESGNLKLKIHNDIFEIKVLDNVEISSCDTYDLDLTYEQAMNIFLNKKISNHRLLNSWFHIDLDIYNNDLV